MIALIQARANSTRFPGKMFETIGHLTVIEYVIRRVASAELVSEVIVLVPHGEGKYFRGNVREDLFGYSEEDVLGRFCRLMPSTRHVLRVCGDNPLIKAEGIDELIRNTMENDDYVGYQWRNKPLITYPSGLVAEVVSCSALRHANDELSLHDSNREHVTSWLYRNPREYRCRWIDVPAWFAGQKLALDTPEDLHRIRQYVQRETEAACLI